MYQRGDAIQAKWGQEWYASKVVEVSEQEPRWLVHYQGWNSRFDEWLPSASVRRGADGAPPASTPAARAPRPAKSAARQQLEASGPRSSASGAQVHTTLSELLAAGKLQPGPIVLDHHRSRPTHITVEAKLLAHHSGVASRRALRETRRRGRDSQKRSIGPAPSSTTARRTRRRAASSPRRSRATRAASATRTTCSTSRTARPSRVCGRGRTARPS